MTWYAAHIVMSLRLKSGVQDSFPIWENIVLLEASSTKEAVRSAEAHGHSAAGDDQGTLTWDRKPAEWRFAGVRKILKCEEEDEQPSGGTEITFSEYILEDDESIGSFVSGDRTTLVCDEGT